MLQRQPCQPGHVPQDAWEQPTNGWQQLQRKMKGSVQPTCFVLLHHATHYL
jgi:hypothetical protein